MNGKTNNYYEARGFSIYYLANAIFSIVATPGAYIRGIEEILGDMRVLTLMRPFHRHTNLHEFIREISIDVLTEDMVRADGEVRFLQQFFKIYRVECPASTFENEDRFWEFVSDCDRFQAAMGEITDEVFHVLFNDIGFLQNFNRLCADYIEQSDFGEERKTKLGTLKRVPIPVWARRAIFHRDKGECRSCKRSLAALINQFDTERYDHIVPLARFGANDVTNLQLLCERCNSKKSAADVPVSNIYQRAIRS